MEILGVGPSELLFVIVIALIILGPKDMQKAGKTIGKWMRDIVTSDGWKMFQQTSHELRTLPNKLMREANNEMNKIGNELNNVIPGKDANDSYRIKNPNISPNSSVPTSPTIGRPVEGVNFPKAEEPNQDEGDSNEDA